MSDTSPSVVALIPARAGSKRVPNKNIREFKGHPLIAYTIKAAIDSGIFRDIVVSTDSEEIADVAQKYGAQAPFMRPAEYAGGLSPDIEWISHAMKTFKEKGMECDAFSLLRPTSPFRTGETISRAWDIFCREDGADSLRAVEKCLQHPCKMWVVRQNRLLPLIPFGPEAKPWHSMPYQALPEVYVQNASLEIAWSKVISETGTIAGATVIPFITEGYEGYDINTMEDWYLAEKLVDEGKVSLNLK